MDSSGALLLGGAYQPLSSAEQHGLNILRNEGSFLNNRGSDHEGPSLGHGDDDFGDDDFGDGGDWEDNFGPHSPHHPDQHADTYDHHLGSSAVSAQAQPQGTQTGLAMAMSTPTKGPALPAAPAAARSTKPQRDVFAQLDPHKVVPGSRAVRKGKTFKIPAALKLSQEERRALNAERLVQSCCAGSLGVRKDTDPSEAAAEMRELGLAGIAPIPVKGLLNPALLPILQERRKQARREQLEAIRAAQVQHQPGQVGHAANASLHEIWQQDYAHAGSSSSSGPEGTLAGTASEGGLGGEDYYYGNDDLDDGFGGEDADDYADHAMGEGECPSATSANAAEDAFAGLEGMIQDSHYRAGAGEGGGLFGSEGGREEEDEEEQLRHRVENVLNESLRHGEQMGAGSYEAICRKYIDHFNRGAHVYAK